MQKLSYALFTLLLSATAISHAGGGPSKPEPDANVQKKVIRIKPRPASEQNECDRVWERLDNGPTHEEAQRKRRERRKHYRQNRKAATLIGAYATTAQ